MTQSAQNSLNSGGMKETREVAQDEFSRLNLTEMGGSLGVTCFATLGGFLFGYDQEVVSNVLAIESFGAAFPKIYMDSNLKVDWVAAWFGSLLNGPICDKIGRKRNITGNIVIFLIGGALQTGATAERHFFIGRAIAGLAVGALTHVVPMYLAEISSANIRGALVALQQLSITLGVDWIAYGTSHIGGTRCAPGVQYTGPLLNGSPTFDPYTDVPGGGCTSQKQASWRVPIGIQLFPALLLGIGMAFMPYSPRWLMERGRDDEALQTLSSLRRKPLGDLALRYEFLEIKAELRYSREITALKYPTRLNSSGLLTTALHLSLRGPNSSVWPFGLGLNPNTTSLLATGLYGILNACDKTPGFSSDTLGTLPAIMLLDSVGRRPLLMSGALGCCAALLIVGSLIAAFGNDWPAHPSADRAAIAFVYFYGVNFAYSWAPIGWVLLSEVFPLHLRSTGISITTSCTWMSNFIIGLVSSRMLTQIGHGGTYFFFAAFANLAFLSALFFYPETNGKMSTSPCPLLCHFPTTLEEMDAAFGDVTNEQEKKHMERICRELGLPSKALLSA
ncbi:general substrate transporter [Pisolithus orientalis]|uniref:general substrate transporter n=1 Tax=Pisolithus orientalis TaxID=936130 RepID=UPI002225ACD7|nr:general substrate transporter [Pisolithus orientalis]KAI5991744.1 general substrate transporter [Pisolithus orientalis]